MKEKPLTASFAPVELGAVKYALRVSFKKVRGAALVAEKPAGALQVPFSELSAVECVKRLKSWLRTKNSDPCDDGDITVGTAGSATNVPWGVGVVCAEARPGRIVIAVRATQRETHCQVDLMSVLRGNSHNKA